MKILDEKGRLFGKINVIDFLVILFLFCLFPLFYFGYKVFTKNPIITEEKELIQTEINYLFMKVSPEVEKIISIGDRELDESSQVIGEITSLGRTMPYKYEFDMGGGQKIIKEDPVLKQIETKLTLTAEVKGEKIYYKDREIKVSSPLEFKTKKYNLLAVPLKETGKEKWVSLRVKFSRLVPEIANVIGKGDTGKDAFGKTIARISSIISDESTLVSTVDAEEDKFLTLKHPFDRDITASIEVLCTEKEGDYYFKDNLAKIGSNITFTTDLYTITGLIVGKDVK